MKKMKGILVGLLTVVLILSMVGCGGEQTKSEGAAGEKKTESKDNGDIVIGYIGPLTGEGALWGAMELNTVKMLVDETNKNGGVLGRKVVLKSYDNRMDAVETTNAANKAILNDRVVAIIGTNTSGCAIALAEVCEQNMVPHLTTVATNPKVTLKDDGTVRPYTFRVSQNDNQLGAAIAKYAYDKMNIKTAAVLNEISSDYSVGVTEVFIKTFSSLGGKVTTTESFKTGDVDYRAQLSKIIATNPDALYLPANYKEMGLASNQVRELGFEGKIIGPDCWLMYELFTIATDSVQGATFVTSVNIADPSFEPFRQTYHELYNRYPDSTNAYYAHDAYNMILYAINKTGEATSEKIREGLETVKDLDLITGKVTMPASHNPIRDAYISVINNKKFEFPEKIRVEED
ncbi:ABC transporter substrate-binding protein [Petroclostridium sp. X23]|uniref:ABC transporter substrate-binding protein n=1 Tax=Petroclostridium sp. X23 TaxID=3045146 RepID=UPI0024AE4323|nr:ABC transporter substrate-binding protein [Petroclostridium sp. X23]WHH61264.1 ABC transporter substrate-binding protein [Petroclostridium sp. X23]